MFDDHGLIVEVRAYEQMQNTLDNRNDKKIIVYINSFSNKRQSLSFSIQLMRNRGNT